MQIKGDSVMLMTHQFKREQNLWGSLKKESPLACYKAAPEQGTALKMEKETLGSQHVRSRTLKGVVVQLMN